MGTEGLRGVTTATQSLRQQSKAHDANGACQVGFSSTGETHNGVTRSVSATWHWGHLSGINEVRIKHVRINEVTKAGKSLERTVEHGLNELRKSEKSANEIGLEHCHLRGNVEMCEFGDVGLCIPVRQGASFGIF